MEQVKEFTTSTFSWVNLNSVISAVEVRRLKEQGIELLKEKIGSCGFMESFPLLVAPLNGGYELINGAHRFQAAKELGLEKVPALIISRELNDAEKKKLARQVNEATETLIPTTFVDDAEFIWREADAGKTQEEIAEIMGWSREKVRNFIMLRNICADAWDMVGTTIEKNVPDKEEGDVPAFGTGVPFTENLLRNIVHLQPDQQLELVQKLADGELNKNKFKTLAHKYQYRNEMREYARSRISGLGSDYLDRCVREIESGAYDSDWEKYTRGETAGPEKLEKLIKYLIEEWEEKNSIQIIFGDFYEEQQNFPDGSVDLILTDPPYNVSNERVFKLAGRSDISQDFGEWDKYEKQAFIDLFREWGRIFYRLLRDGGSGYIFTSDEYISYLWDALKEQGLNVKATVVWHKTNPGTQVVKTNYRSSVEYILFFTKGEEHTFHWFGENEMHNFIEAPICGGEERVKDSKGNTMHPTQKPLQVLKHLVERSSNGGDVVFDCFAGAGSTAVAAKDLGRRCICIERDESFCEAARRRLE